MVQIPRSTPQQVNLNPSTAVREIPDLPNTGDMLAQAGKGIAETGGMVEKALSVAEQTKVQNQAAIKLADIQYRASEDPDFSPENQKKYHEEIDSTIQEASKGISIPQARDAFLSEASKDAYVQKIKVNQDFTRRQIDNGKAELIVYMDQLGKDFINTNSPEERKNIILKRDAKFEEMAQAGYIDRAFIAEQKIATQKNWDELWVNNVIINDTSTETGKSVVLNELLKGDSGAFAELDSAQRAEAIKKSRLKINENKQYGVERQVDNRLEILNQFANNKIKWEDADLINKITIADPDLGEAIKNGTKGSFAPADKEQYFDEAVRMVYKAGSAEAISTFLMNTLNASDNKRISADKLAILINAGVQRSKSLRKTEKNAARTLDPKQIEQDAAVQSILRYKNPIASGNNILMNFFNGINAGKDARTAHDEAINAETTRVNPMKMKFKGDGTDPIIQLPNGKMFQVTGFTSTGAPTGKIVNGKSKPSTK